MDEPKFNDPANFVKDLSKVIISTPLNLIKELKKIHLILLKDMS